MINLVGEVEGKPDGLPDGKTQTSDEFIFACGWCGKVRMGDDWLDLGEAIDRMQHLELPLLPKLTHGVCDACRVHLERELDELKRRAAGPHAVEPPRRKKAQMTR
jgi:hypothetical protein